MVIFRFLIRTFSFVSQDVVYTGVTYFCSNSLNFSVRDIAAAFTKSEHSEKMKNVCLEKKKLMLI